MMASMRDWLKGPDANKERVVIVHCKAGKGRSGTVACSYLISEEGWTVEDALTRFTERRMRSGFGAGVSIPSQLRWVGYVDKWTKHRKLYVERQVEVLELHVWGLKEGVKVGINGYIDEGRTIKTFHVFGKDERILVDSIPQTDGASASFLRLTEEKPLPTQESSSKDVDPNPANADAKSGKQISSPSVSHTGDESGGSAVIFRPSTRIILPSNDIDIDFERRNKAAYGWTMVTSVAHVWFNTFFEGRGPENHGNATSDGVFEIEWDAMDGIRGSARKGIRSLDRLAVVWRALVDSTGNAGATQIITEPEVGQPVSQTPAADWRGANPMLGKDLGLRTASPASVNVSKASSLASAPSVKADDDTVIGVKAHGPEGEDHIPHDTDSSGPPESEVSDFALPSFSSAKPSLSGLQSEPQVEPDTKSIGDVGLGSVDGTVNGVKKF